MKYIEVAGGLGNQMFQYAYYLLIKNRFGNARLFISSDNWEHKGGFELTKIFDIQYEPTLWERIYHKGKIFRKLFTLTHRRYQGRNFQVQQSDLNPPSHYGYFYGTWQSEKYFYDKQLILDSFRFDESLLSEQTRKVAEELKDEISISVHIRRGDYLSQQFSAGFGNCCPLDYYERAIDIICKEIVKPRFVFFSDDMDWVSKNLHVPNSIYVNHNHGADSWQDMFLMSQCDHNIIANSTFSWWGAWLNSNCDKIVIAPQRWWSSIDNDDVVPASWIRV